MGKNRKSTTHENNRHLTKTWKNNRQLTTKIGKPTKNINKKNFKKTTDN